MTGKDETTTLLEKVASAHARSETRLEELAPSSTRAPRRLHDAMRHSLLTAGKRVRPILTVLTAQACGGGDGAPALTPGCAIEMIHAASLILDDLPAMDDASLRRGRPTSHAMFGADRGEHRRDRPDEPCIQCRGLRRRSERCAENPDHRSARRERRV
ncbi:MAG: polyprenyl synthetase family protein [Pseudomonadota bacterium]